MITIRVVTRNGRTNLFSAYTITDAMQQATDWAGDDLILETEEV